MAEAAAKRAAPAGGGGGSICAADRLSALPDDLLLHIVSFLPAQHAVQTTALSKRWVDLWRSAPCINLDLTHFRKSPYEHWRDTSVRMEAFVSKLLMLHKASCLDSFNLTASYADHDSLRHIHAWMRHAIRGDPKVIKVRTMCFYGYDLLYQLPHLGSSNPTCRRLTSLKLTGVSLDNSFTELFHSAAWPHLADVVLVQCQLAFPRIESERLKILGFQYCTAPAAEVFVIRAPRLASLSMSLHSNSCAKGVVLDMGSPLVRASVSLKRDEFSARNEAILLGSLCNVTSLEIRDFQAMAILDTELFDKLPVFNNLRNLALNPFSVDDTISDEHNSFKALGRFLQKTPNMETLTLENFWVAPTVELVEIPGLQNLRTLILDTCDLDDNFGLLQYYLLNSPNLEKLIAQYCKVSDGSKEMESPKMVSLHYPKLKSELKFYGRNASIPVLHRFLLDISVPKNSIKFTNMKYRFMACQLS